MKKLGLLILGLFLISGCHVHTYTVRQPRKDTEITGNQGYIMGKPSPEDIQKKESRLSDTRPITVMEVGLDSGTKEESAKSSKYTTRHIYKKKSSLEEADSEEPSELIEFDIEEEIGEREAVEVKDWEKPTVDYQYYVIKKNDTLQKISYKFYGTTRKWKMIYQENKDKLKSSDSIYPGTKIRIPVFE
jgi:nucleoid-associated protein YgaU